MKLSDLEVGNIALILNVGNFRFEHMGIVPNKIVKVLRRNATCLHIRIGISEWAIRDKDAACIKIIPR